MSFSILNFIPVIGLFVIGLVYMAYRIHSEGSKHIAELEFFLKQKTISYNQERAKLAVFKTQHESLQREMTDLQTKFSQLQEKEEEFNRAIKRNRFLEHKNSEYEKLEIEITNIQETLNGNIRKQLKNYMKEVEGLGQRLHKATYQFNENTKMFEFIDSKDAA